MERLLGGLIAALVLALCLAPAARAAEIPPTAKCETTFKKLFKSYIRSTPEKPTKEQEAATGKKLVEDLESAGCISDAEAAYSKAPAKPFTEQCVDAAGKAESFMGPMTARLTALQRGFTKNFQRPHQRQSNSLARRISILKAKGRPDRAAELRRESRQLDRAFKATSKKFARRVTSVYRDSSYKTVLIFLELFSLRCLDTDIEEEFHPGSPAQRVINRNIALIVRSNDLLEKEANRGRES